MVKPNIPNIPGMGAVTDTLDFVKNLWGGMGLPGVNIPGMNAGGLNIPGMGGAGMNIPGMVMPTLSVEEINKKISDLKAVEAWLTLNQNMLRGTIQALEVQAATITTLKTMGETFTASMKSAGGDRPEARTSATSSASSGTSSAASSSSHSAKSFYSPNGNGSGGSGNGASAGHSSSSQANGNGNGSHAGRRQDEESDDDEPASRSAASAEPTAEDQQEAANLTAPLVNAAAWWNMLQDQFKQAVSSAMVPEPGKDGKATAGSGSKEKTDSKSGGKPAAGSAGAKTVSKSAASKPATKSRAGSSNTGSAGGTGTTAKRKTSK